MIKRDRRKINEEANSTIDEVEDKKKKVRSQENQEQKKLCKWISHSGDKKDNAPASKERRWIDDYLSKYI